MRTVKHLAEIVSLAVGTVKHLAQVVSLVVRTVKHLTHVVSLVLRTVSAIDDGFNSMQDGVNRSPVT